jgi:hypothetical protein
VTVRREVRRLIGAAVAGLVLLSAFPGSSATAETAGAASPVSAPPLAADGTGLELGLTKVTPAMVGPAEEVVVNGTLRNLGSTAIKNARITLWLRREALPDREAINTWLAEGTLTPADHQIPATARVRSLAAGATARFSIKVPPGATGLFRSSGFGPRAIALQAKAGGRRQTLLRSTIVWSPTEITTPTRLSVIIPITSSTPSSHAGEPTADLAASLLSNGRLRRVLSAAHDQAIAWAVDPAVLTGVQRMSEDGIDRTPDDAALSSPDAADPSPTPSSTASGAAQITDPTAKATALEWLTLFNTERRGRGLFGLPYADPDLTSVLRSPKGIPLLRSSDTLGRTATTEVLGAPLDTTLAWPADGRINAATTRSLARLKRTSVILAGNSQQPEPKLDYTPTGASIVRSSSGPLTGLLYDEQLSALISSPGSRTPAATQTLLAQLAAITLEQPDLGRHLLAVTPRNWNPDPTAFQHLMNALGSAPWINLRGISELQKAAASAPPRSAPAYRKAAAKAELPIGVISAAQVLDKGLAAFAPILVDPAPADPLRERVASLVSVAWRQNRSGTYPARQDVAEDVNALVDGVRLEAGPYFFTARKQNIPVSVVNSTKYDIKVVVQLTPLTGHLTISKPEPIEVGPNKTAPVLLEAKARVGGDGMVEGKLLNVDGVELGPGKNFTVRVRPNWESRGMIVVGSILGFLLVIGLLRGLRRNRTRTRVPIEAVPDVDELATRRAAEAENGDPEVRAAAQPSGRPNPGPTPGNDARLLADPDSNPFPDPVPVPISMPEAEPDPKVLGGPVDLDGVRPRVEPRPGQSVRPG